MLPVAPRHPAPVIGVQFKWERTEVVEKSRTNLLPELASYQRSRIHEGCLGLTRDMNLHASNRTMLFPLIFEKNRFSSYKSLRGEEVLAALGMTTKTVFQRNGGPLSAHLYAAGRT
jgi:hypothetical protein